MGGEGGAVRECNRDEARENGGGGWGYVLHVGVCKKTCMRKEEGERQSKSCEIESVKERERKCERERENVTVQCNVLQKSCYMYK